MCKTAIIYASIHHGNTKKLVDAISVKYDIDLIDATKINEKDLSMYDLIGFASGIDFGKFYDCVEVFLYKCLPDYKKVFFLYTCAKINKTFTKSIKDEALKKHSIILGEYGCKGYNTYGPLRFIGGMNKENPNQEELNNAIVFFESILKTL